MEKNKEKIIIETLIKTLNLIEPIKSSYKTIRIWLQREGYTTKSVERVSEMPFNIMEEYSNFNKNLREIKNEVKKYGFDNSDEIVVQIVSEELLKIDKEFPLVDEL
jgi:phage-related protein